MKNFSKNFSNFIFVIYKIVVKFFAIVTTIVMVVIASIYLGASVGAPDLANAFFTGMILFVGAIIIIVIASALLLSLMSECT